MFAFVKKYTFDPQAKNLHCWRGLISSFTLFIITVFLCQVYWKLHGSSIENTSIARNMFWLYVCCVPLLFFMYCYLLLYLATHRLLLFKLGVIQTHTALYVQGIPPYLPHKRLAIIVGDDGVKFANMRSTNRVIPYKHIVSIKVRQTILGRLLNYGRIRIKSSGWEKTINARYVNAPYGMKAYILNKAQQAHESN